MAFDTTRACSNRSYRSSVRYSATVTLIGCASVYGCSFKNVNYLSEGSSAGSSSMGGDSNAGGGGASGGESDQGGGGGIEYMTTAKGGSAQGGTSATTTTSSGGTGQKDCAYTGTGGQLLTPPSESFELGSSGWTTQGARAYAVSRVNSEADSCDGAWYLTTDGTQRSASWDGPATSLLPYIVKGRSYRVSLAARLSPSGSPSAAKVLTLVMAKKCVNTEITDVYTQLMAKSAFVSWVRLSGSFEASMAGCDELSAFDVYIDTGETDAPFSSVDVDDLKFVDVTVDSAGTGGTSG